MHVFCSMACTLQIHSIKRKKTADENLIATLRIAFYWLNGNVKTCQCPLEIWFIVNLNEEHAYYRSCFNNQNSDILEMLGFNPSPGQYSIDFSVSQQLVLSSKSLTLESDFVDFCLIWATYDIPVHSVKAAANSSTTTG